MMKTNGFYKLFVKELRDLFNAENQIVKLMPRMIEASFTPELREAFESHLEESYVQIQRLEKIFATLNERPEGEVCKAMRGLVEEAQDAIDSDFTELVKDAYLIGAAQRIEHYEMAGYGVARTFADQLNLTDVKDLLDETLDEESNADEELTKIAQGGFFTAGVNKRAKEGF